MAANPSGANGPRIGIQNGRNRNSLANLMSKQDSATLSLDIEKEIRDRRRSSVTPTKPANTRIQAPDFSKAIGSLNQAQAAATAQASLTALAYAALRGRRGGNRGSGGGGNSNGVAAAAGGIKGSGYMASPAEAKAMLAQMARKRGYSNREIKRLNWIIEGHNGIPGESGFNIHADNPTSTAIGIPQLLQSTHGYVSDRWLNNARPQLRWFLDYIKNRYGTAQAAWQHKKTVEGHWY